MDRHELSHELWQPRTLVLVPDMQHSLMLNVRLRAALVLVVWYSASVEGHVTAVETRLNSTVLDLVNPVLAGCSLQGSWADINRNSKDGEQRFRAGGLGQRSTETFNIWVCDLFDPCAFAPCSKAPDLMCYAFDEGDKTFLPIDLNSKIKFVKQDLIDPNHVAARNCTTAVFGDSGFKPTSSEAVAASDKTTPLSTTPLPSSRAKALSTPAPPVLNASALSRYLTLSGHQNYVMSVALEDAVIVTGSDDNTCKIWDRSSGALLHTLSGHTSSVKGVAISGNLVLTASADRDVKVWNSTSGALVKTLSGHTDYVYCVAASSQGVAVTGSEDNTAKVWNVSTGLATGTLSGHGASVAAVAISADGDTVVTASWDHSIKLWDASRAVLTKTLSGHTDWVWAVALSPDGTLAVSGSDDLTAKVWDVVSGALVRTLTGHTSGIRSVAFSPLGTEVVTGAKDNIAKIWDISTGAVIRNLESHTDWVRGVAVSADGATVVTVSDDTTGIVWHA